MEDNLDPITLEYGKPLNLGGNTTIRYRIEFTSGSYIESIVPANGRLVICGYGDIKKVDLYPGEELGKPMTVVD